ncbi:MAG: hypothetical protein CVU05_10810 [Bacteroidetes bacterium HGW-Bacteroidetes-21]|jgi:hypothetical protein|nr:MAG: hypothetical protein CVU05_10810 [Bacteroidetes bacterium HGW-Bacteroidetes-21]
MKAQTDSSGRGMTISEVYFHYGSTFSGHKSIGFEDFKKLAPMSVLMAGDFSDFSYWSNTDGYNANVNMGLSLSPTVQNEKYDMKIRFDLSFVSQTPFTLILQKTDRTTFDTLVSNSTGKKIPVDSIKNWTKTLSLETEQLEINSSVIFSTSPLKRWSFYGGVGFFGAYTVYAQTRIENQYYAYTDPYIANNTYIETPFFYESEVFTNNSGYTFGGYIPVGLSFRVSKNQKFWERMSIIYEMQFGYQDLFISELGNFSGAFTRQKFGLRFNTGKLPDVD